MWTFNLWKRCISIIHDTNHADNPSSSVRSLRTHESKDASNALFRYIYIIILSKKKKTAKKNRAEKEGCWISTCFGRRRATTPSASGSPSAAASPTLPSSTISSSSTSNGANVRLFNHSPFFVPPIHSPHPLSFYICFKRKKCVGFNRFRSIRARQPAQGFQSRQQGSRSPQNCIFFSSSSFFPNLLLIFMFYFSSADAHWCWNGGSPAAMRRGWSRARRITKSWRRRRKPKWTRRGRSCLLNLRPSATSFMILFLSATMRYDTLSPLLVIKLPFLYLFPLRLPMPLLCVNAAFFFHFYQANSEIVRSWGEKRAEASLRNHVELVQLLEIADLVKGTCFLSTLLLFAC